MTYVDFENDPVYINGTLDNFFKALKGFFEVCLNNNIKIIKFNNSTKLNFKLSEEDYKFLKRNHSFKNYLKDSYEHTELIKAHNNFDKSEKTTNDRIKLEKKEKLNGQTLEQIKIIFKCTDTEIEAVQKLLLSSSNK